MIYQGFKPNNHSTATTTTTKPTIPFLKRRQIFSIECACLKTSLDITILSLPTPDLKSKEISPMLKDMYATFNYINWSDTRILKLGIGLTL